jgi:hypothetical protein
MKITVNTVGGQWLDKKELKGGELAKLKTEAIWSEGQNGQQLVAKIRIKGSEEDKNVAINKPTQAALVSAFGDDSLNWIDKLLTVNVETGIFAGKRGVMLNLVPEGYVVAEDTAGYIVIRPKVEPPTVVARQTPPDYPVEDINPDDIPF